LAEAKKWFKVQTALTNSDRTTSLVRATSLLVTIPTGLKAKFARQTPTMHKATQVEASLAELMAIATNRLREDKTLIRVQEPMEQ